MPGREFTIFQLLIKTSILLFFSLILVACSGNNLGFISEQRDESLYIPPTANFAIDQETKPTEITTASPTPQLIKTPATPTPSCSYDLQFIEDLTIPDGTIVSSRAALDKRWQVENTGTCNWDENYRLKLITGMDLGASPEQALFPARSGTAATIQINFTAPSEGGSYQSAWQAVSPQGDLFGDPIYIDIVVDAQVTDS